MEDKPIEQKLYLGNLQEKTRENGSTFLIGSICVDDIINVPTEYIRNAKRGKRYVKVVINQYRDGPNEHGNTHSIAVDTFKPKDENFNKTMGGEEK